MSEAEIEKKNTVEMIGKWTDSLIELYDGKLSEDTKKKIEPELKLLAQEYKISPEEAEKKFQEMYEGYAVDASLKKKLHSPVLELQSTPETAQAQDNEKSRKSVGEVVDTFRQIGKIHQRNDLGKAVNKHIGQFDVVMATLSLFGVSHDKLDEGISKIITSEGRKELKEVASKKIEDISPELRAKTEGMIEAIAGLAEKILDSKKMENALDSFSRFAVNIPVFGPAVEKATDTAKEAVRGWANYVKNREPVRGGMSRAAQES